MRLRLAGSVAIFCGTAAYGQGGAPCQLPHVYSEQLATFSASFQGTTLSRQQGLVYLDAGCLQDARVQFKRAIDQAKTQTGASADMDVAFGEHALELVDGYQAFRDGRYESAISILTDTSDESMPGAVSLRAVFAVAEILSARPNDSAWKLLEPKLKILEERRNLWRARRYLYLHDLTAVTAPEKIHKLEAQIQEELPVQHRLEIEILIAELMTRSGSTSQADLLVRDIEKEVGLKIIPVDLRAEYVRVCSLVAAKKAELGDADAAQRLAAYKAALGAMYDPN